MKRLEFIQEVHGRHGLTMQLLTRFQKGLFKELEDNEILIKLRRQGIQIGYIIELDSAIQESRKLNDPKNLAGLNRYIHGHSIFGKGMFEFEALKNKISSILGDVSDPITHGHLLNCVMHLGFIKTDK